MNSNQQPTQPAGMQNGQQQPRPQQASQRPQIQLFRPEQMRALPAPFTDEEKHKWEEGLRKLYSTKERTDPSSEEHQLANKKLREFSISLQQKLVSASRGTQRSAQAFQSGQQQQSMPTGQPPVQQGPMGNAPQQTGQAQGQGTAAMQPQQQRPQTGQGGTQNTTKISESIMKHANSLNFTLPQALAEGSPAAEQWKLETRQKYAMALAQCEQLKGVLKNIEAQKEQRIAAGKTLSEGELAKYTDAVARYTKTYNESHSYVMRIRQITGFQASGIHTGQEATPLSVPGQQIPMQMQMQQAGPTTASVAPARAPVNAQQASVNAAAQQQAQNINAAFDAARNQPQQMNPQRPALNLHQVDNTHSNNNNQQNHGQPSVEPTVKVEGQTSMQAQMPLGINTAAAMQQQRQMQNSPRTAGPPHSSTPTTQPQVLTQQEAQQRSARAYSNSQVQNGTPQAMGVPPNGPRGFDFSRTAESIKIPIPKNLPPSTLGTPQPAGMAPSRPTLSGGPNNQNAIVGQPVLPRNPPYDTSEGDRIMSKRKLDELVRQVTGGGESDQGGGITADVEEAVLQVADEFVDQVVTAACKCAKARGSKVLEIRDLQLILERNYNIRIPGYASDEVRTVRKFQPAQGWIAKMSAIQAAKVTQPKGPGAA